MSVHHGPGRHTATISTTPKSFLAAMLSLACVFSVGIDVPSLAAMPAAAKDKKTKKMPFIKNLPITDLSADEAILHALNRLAYGPRPGDVERVRQMGLAKWIDQQLNPNSIDDKAMEARLENYPTLNMSTAKLIEEYPQPKAGGKGRLETGAGSTAAGAAAALGRLRNRGERHAGTAGQAPESPANQKMETENASAERLTPEMKDAPAPMKQKIRRREIPGAQTPREAAIVWAGRSKQRCRARLQTTARRPQRVVAELRMAKVTRAIYSERQLAASDGRFLVQPLQCVCRQGRRSLVS